MMVYVLTQDWYDKHAEVLNESAEPISSTLQR